MARRVYQLTFLSRMVGANRGGIPDALGNMGRLVDPEDVGEFAEKPSELIGNQPSSIGPKLSA